MKKLKVILIIVLISGIYASTYTSFFEVSKVEVSGNAYYTDVEIANIAHADIGANLYHKTSSSEMKKYLRSDPFIDSASVYKIPPGTVKIKVKERRQAGAVVYGDEYLIIDNNGVLLRRTNTRPKITIISGVQISRMEEGERLGSTDETIFQNSLDIIKAMEEGDLYFIELDMTEMYCSAHVYDALVVTGTADQLISAIDLGRLQKVLQTLFERGIKRGTISVSDDGFASFSPSV